MPSIKRWFHKSQDINRDPEYRAYLKKFGLPGAMFWDEMLGLLDRTDNHVVNETGIDFDLLAATCMSKRRIMQASYDYLVNINWLRVVHEEGFMPFTMAPNWLEYNKRREQKRNIKETKKEQLGTYPNPTPIPCLSIPKNKSKDKEKNVAKAPHAVNGHSLKKVEKPESVEDDVWRDFVTHRKTKKAAITETALKGFVREAEKAGVPLNDALRITVERGWVGFRSDWGWKDEKPTQAEPPPCAKRCQKTPTTVALCGEPSTKLWRNNKPLCDRHYKETEEATQREVLRQIGA